MTAWPGVFTGADERPTPEPALVASGPRLAVPATGAANDSPPAEAAGKQVTRGWRSPAAEPGRPATEAGVGCRVEIHGRHHDDGV